MSDQRNHWDDREIEAALREFESTEAELLEPPERVWVAIQARLHASEQALKTDSGADTDLSGGSAEVSSVRRGRSAWTALAVAAAVCLVAGLAVAITTLTRDDSARIVASAELSYDQERFDPLGAQARGRADLVERGGRHTVELADASLVAAGADADLEVWLIRPDVQGAVAGLVSLGIIDPDDPAALEVPSGYDPFVYNVVDISIEPRDGEPGHSGRTILRGPLLQT